MGTAVTIGNFDGAHAGHAALVARCRDVVGGSGRVIVLTFDPHPRSVLGPGPGPARLSTIAQRERWLRAIGVDEVVALRPEPALLARSPTDFLSWLRESFAPDFVVEGEDFRFGKGRAGTSATLRETGPAYGFAGEIVGPVEVALADQTLVKASSSLARWLVAHGRAGDAASVLGRPHEIEGVVERGDRLGRALGVPTANFVPEQMLPGDGVYAVEGELPDGRVRRGALSVGTRPTVKGGDRRCEVHLLGVAREGDAIAGLPEYGWRLRVRVLAWLREQMKFDGLDALKGQMARDLARAARVERGAAMVSTT